MQRKAAIALSLLSVITAPLATADEAWTTSWPAFVASYSKCLEEGCDGQQYLDKQVTWELKVDSVKLDGPHPSIGFDMKDSPRFANTKEGVSADIIAFSVNPRLTQTSQWKDVQPGQVIRFRTTLGLRPDGTPQQVAEQRAKAKFLNHVVEFTSRGRPIIGIVYTSGAELVR